MDFPKNLTDGHDQKEEVKCVQVGSKTKRLMPYGKLTCKTLQLSALQKILKTIKCVDGSKDKKKKLNK